MDTRQAEEALAGLKANLAEGKSVSKKDVDDIAETLPQTPAIRKTLLGLYTDIGAFDRIEQVSETILDEDPTNIPVRLALVALLVRRRATVHFTIDPYVIARRHLETIESQAGVRPAHWLAITQYYLKMKDYVAALPSARRAAAELSGAQEVTARLFVVDALLGSGDASGARRELESVTLEPSRPDHGLRAAAAFEALGLPARAVAVGRSVRPHLPSPAISPREHIQLAKLLMRHGAESEAHSLMLEAGPVTAKIAAEQVELHDICFALGLNDLALFHAQAVLATSPYDKKMTERVSFVKLLAQVPAEPIPDPKSPNVVARLMGRLGLSSRRSGP